MGFDRLHHHDGVIDHESDRQYHAEQRKRIDTEAQHREKSKSTDKRNRHSNKRNERGPPTLKKNEHDQNHKHHGLEEGLHDFLHSIRDRQRRIQRDLVLQPGWKNLGLTLKEGPNLFHRIHRIRPGKLVDCDNGRIFAVETPANVVNLATQLDFGDILDPHYGSIGIGADDDIFKLLRCCESIGRGHSECENLTIRSWLSADLSCGIDLVLRAYGIDDLRNGDFEGGETIWFYPNAHGVLPRTENAHTSNARNTCERIVDIDVGVVRQKRRIELPVVGIKHKDTERG